MVNGNAENCWEYWNCPTKVKENCPAFLAKKSKTCWLLSRDYYPKRKEAGFKNCWNCS